MVLNYKEYIMKKVLFAALITAFACSTPAFAGDEDATKVAQSSATQKDTNTLSWTWKPKPRI
jgi:hypothetical protein